MTAALQVARMIRRFSVALSVVALALGTGCSSDEPNPAPSASTGSPTPSVNTEEDQARAAALAAYNGFREAQVAASATADIGGGELARYVADPLLTELKLDLKVKREQGLVTQGRPVWNARVTTVDVSTRPFTAQIEDCFDSTNWPTVFKADGKPAGIPAQNKKYLVTAEASLYDDGRWLISKAKAERDRPC